MFIMGSEASTQTGVTTAESRNEDREV